MPSRKEGPLIRFLQRHRNPLHRRICSSKPLRCFCDSYEQTMGFLDICAMDVLLDLWFEALSKTCNNNYLANINVASVCCNALCNAQSVFAHSTARSLNSETSLLRNRGAMALHSRSKKAATPAEPQAHWAKTCLAPQPNMTPPY